MKRFIVAIGWFAIINFILNFIGAFIAGLRNAFANPPMPAYEVGMQFAQKYGWITFFVSLLVAVIGTLTGKLPYTKKDPAARDKKAV